MEPRPEIVVSSFEDKEVNEYVEKLNQISLTYGPEQTILVRIDSFGGSIYGLATIYEALKTLKNPILTYTTSKAMSAGAILLATAGSPGMRFASPNSSIMIHEVSSGSIGHIEDMEGEVEMLKLLNEKWMDMLAKALKLKTAKDIRSLVKSKGSGRELYLSAEQSKALNIIDQVGYVDIQPIMGYNINVSLQAPQAKPRKKHVRKN